MALELLKKDFSEQNPAPVYLLYGEDRYSLLQCVSAIKGIFLIDDPSGSNIEVFQGKDSTIERIVETLNSSSFFARKLVIVDDIPYFDQDKGKNSSEEDKEQDSGQLSC
jgi:DNA polymerase-3 subunit delta